MNSERAVELAEQIADRWSLGVVVAFHIRDYILQACAEEREACAKIADKYADSYDYGDGPRIAADIRGGA